MKSIDKILEQKFNYNRENYGDIKLVNAIRFVMKEYGEEIIKECKDQLLKQLHPVNDVVLKATILSLDKLIKI